LVDRPALLNSFPSALLNQQGQKESSISVAHDQNVSHAKKHSFQAASGQRHMYGIAQVLGKSTVPEVVNADSHGYKRKQQTSTDETSAWRHHIT